jgi:hypothetical protein
VEWTQPAAYHRPQLFTRGTHTRPHGFALRGHDVEWPQPAAHGWPDLRTRRAHPRTHRLAYRRTGIGEYHRVGGGTALVVRWTSLGKSSRMMGCSGCPTDPIENESAKKT